MNSGRKVLLSRLLEIPFPLAALLTVVFYLFVGQDSMKDSLLYRYTTEHAVEYVIVGFFIWGITDVVYRAFSFPRELLALRQEWLPRRTSREPASNAAALHTMLQKKPQWLRESRVGQRLIRALAHLQEKGSADDISDYLRYLADEDYERTQSNYGLIRFICWVTPMFGFLGTVVHFGTALGGQSAGDIGDKLPTVVAEMGTAFNTTTVALTAATSMMFGLFLCERTERGIVAAIDHRAERDLMNRFEMADANLTPFLAAVESASRSTLDTMDAGLERQLDAWTTALQALQHQSEKQQQWQSQVWVEALERLEQRFEANDAEREKRLVRLLDALESHHKEHRLHVASTVDQMSTLKTDFSRLVEALNGISHGEGELLKLQAILTDNLRMLRDTQQIDQALHGLTAAIHILTARNQPSSRAA